MKRLIFIVLLALFALPQPIFASNNLWKINSVDTMKYSRDASRDPAVAKLIPAQVKAIADTGANYIAIDTPYDDEFIPRLTLWVKEARKDNLHIWFRGNFSGWEGWFEYPRLTSTSEHIQKTYKFITQNPDLFKDGDLYTPAPEAENGILGDPRQTGKKDEFNQFLLSSYTNCNNAFAKIGKQVNCGVWSENTDVVRDAIYPSTIQKLGGVVSIDHYTNTPEKLISDVKALHTEFNAQVVLGEFGAPIPDINGNMTDSEQANYIQKVLQYTYENKDIVGGMNYWVIAGGSTTLLADSGTPKPAYYELQKYFEPISIKGTVKNPLGEPLYGVSIESQDKINHATTDEQGNFELTVPANPTNLNLTREDLFDQTKQVASSPKNIQVTITMTPVNPDLLYRIKLWFQTHFTFHL